MTEKILVEDKESETDFPVAYNARSFHATSFSARLKGVHKVIEVEDWFKRCMEDFPKPHDAGYGSDGEKFSWAYYDEEIMDEWFEKWFSQFKEIES